MKKPALIFLIVVSLVSLLLIIPAGSSDKSLGKVSAVALEEAVEKGAVKVVVKLKEPEIQTRNLRARDFRATKIQAKKIKEINKEEFKTRVAELTKKVDKKDLKIGKQTLGNNYFAAKVTEKGLEELAQNPDVESIEYDIPFHAALHVSVPLINATLLYNIEMSTGVKINGTGTTICVVDTGVNYSHPDLDGCEYKNVTLTGNQEDNDTFESSHPYSNDYSNEWTITREGFDNIAVHFDKMYTEGGYDFIYVKNASGTVVATYSGERFNVWSPNVSGDTIIVNLTSDGSYTFYGFSIDKFLNGTSTTTYNWSNCNRVLGGNDTFNYDTDPYDDNSHGTHVAGIAAASGGINGTAPGANIVAVKVLNSSGSGSSSDITSGINWCSDNKDKYNISVITISIATKTTHSSYCDNNYNNIKAAINDAVGNGIIVTVATGNENDYNGIGCPACITNSTRVTSTDKSDNYASYANRDSSFPDILVATGGVSGNKIISTSMSGGSVGKYGTSMATPHVAGVVALLQQYKQQEEQTNLTPQEIEDALRYGGILLWDTQTSMNYSRIDADTSLRIVDEKPPSLNLLFPTNGATVSNNNSISLNLSIFDVNLNTSSCTYSINFTANQSISNCENTTFSVPSDGTYNLTIYTFDESLNYTGGNEGGNMNQTTIFFTVDFGLVISLTNPDNGSIITPGDFLNFSVSATNGVSSVWYDNGTANITLANTSATDWYLNTTDWSTGQQNIILYANDTNSNKELEHYSFVSDFAPNITAWLWNNGTDTNTTSYEIYAQENDTLLINLTVDDTDSYSTLSYLWNISNGTSTKFTNTSQNLTYPIGLQDYGNYTITVNISDTKLSTTETWNISTSDPFPINWSSALPDDTSDETSWTYDVSQYINNTDGDDLTYWASQFSISSAGVITNSFSCSGSGTYNINVNVTDGQVTLNDTFTLTVSDSRVCESGGTSGGGSTSSEEAVDTVSKTFSSVSPEAESKFEIDEEGKIPATEVIFKPKETIENVKITVKGLASKPTDVSEAPNVVYKYMNLSAKNLVESQLSSAYVRFRVENSWIDGKNVEQDGIKLMRYSGDWQNLTTIRTGKDSNYTHYKAIVPGFSYFAIVATEKLPDFSTTEASNVTANQTQSSEADGASTVVESITPGEIPKWMIILGLVAVIIVGTAFIWNHYHSKDSSEESDEEKSEE